MLKNDWLLMKIIRKLRNFRARIIAQREQRSQQKKQYTEYLADWKRFSEDYSQSSKRLPLLWENRFPITHDKTSYTPYDRHYTYHPAWAMRVLLKTAPVEHVDISSILIFSVLLSAYMQVRFYDYRPAEIDLDRFTSEHANLTNLPFLDQSIKSLSCMHVIEHVGLGRYGDPIDSDGDVKALRELQRVLAPGGNLLVVVPVGRPRIMFNAHRVYGYSDLIELLDELTLVEFSLIPDDEKDGGLIREASSKLVAEQEYGCGCYWFRRDIASEQASIGG